MKPYNLKKNALKPWLKESWCIPSKQFVCAMENVLEVYTQPYDEHNPLVCMDKSHEQQTQEVRKPIAAQPGLPQRYDTEYERNGVSQRFMFFEPRAGKRFINVTERRTAIDWAHQIKWLVDECYPKAHRMGYG